MARAPHPPSRLVALLLPEKNPVTSLLLIAMVGVYGLLALRTGTWMSFDVFALLLSGANFGPSTLAGMEFYRLLTYGALHGGLLHLLFNGYALSVLGPMIEERLGSTRFALVFVAAIIGGGLASALLHSPPVPSVGASGGILGLVGAGLALLHGRQDAPAQALRTSLLQWLFIMAIFSLFGATAGLRIDNWCHLGGLLTGAAVAWLVTRMEATAPRARRWETGLAVGLLVITLAGPALRQVWLADVPLDRGQTESQQERVRQQAWAPCRDALTTGRYDQALRPCRAYHNVLFGYPIGHELMLLVHEAQGNAFLADRHRALLQAYGVAPPPPRSAEEAQRQIPLLINRLDHARFR